MSSSKTKVYKIKLQSYNDCEIEILISNTVTDSIKYLEKNYKLDLKDQYGSDGYAMRVVNDTTNETRFFVCLSYDTITKVIVHESLHISWFFLEWLGIEVTVDNHEVLAYLQEYVFKSIMEVYDKNKIVK
jgi:hypothetical protein